MRYLRDLLWILPASLVMGLVLSLLGPGIWWIGWLAYAILLILGMLAASVLWRSAGAPTVLGVMLLLAFVLRLGLGMAFSYILPVAGNDTQVQHAGYIFPDAYRRDTQAWALASSGDSLWKAFDKSFSSDQYGGLLFLGSLLDRALSPDAQRPWLMIVVASLTAVIGVALAWKAADKIWGKSIALGVGWIMVLFPEAVLLGSSQMREPFLITFIAMAFLGVTHWAQNHRSAAGWLIGSLVGMLLFSPGIAVISILLLAGWLWLQGKERRIHWLWIVGAGMIVVLSFLLMAWAVGGSLQVKSGPLGTLANWMHYTVQFDSQKLEQDSGWVKTIFSNIPVSLHLPAIISYGIIQPVLPAAIGDPAVWPMQVLGILRGIGWYALLPLLIYAIYPIWRMTNKRDRLAWLWLWLVVWVWIIISAARGGGDQWDNPRYRTILLVFEAILASKVILIQMQTHERWLGRFLAIESVFVVCFSVWTWTRYDTNPYLLPLGATLVVFLGASLIILVGDLFWEKYGHRRSIKRVGKYP
jgi:4-amino-4-deoxy-L-arabinose transferase-like glycosyltransferase